jgi:hypothetical protein
VEFLPDRGHAVPSESGDTMTKRRKPYCGAGGRPFASIAAGQQFNAIRVKHHGRWLAPSVSAKTRTDPRPVVPMSRAHAKNNAASGWPTGARTSHRNGVKIPPIVLCMGLFFKKLNPPHPPARSGGGRPSTARCAVPTSRRATPRSVTFRVRYRVAAKQPDAVIQFSGNGPEGLFMRLLHVGILAPHRTTRGSLPVRATRRR